LADTYTFDAGSSPTNTVASPGTTPSSVSRAVVPAISARMSAAIALPSIICAGMPILATLALW
jgi:hypothetical protein